MMKYCKRGKVNAPRVATSKRYLFWMIVALAAARSVLRERAAFATLLGSFARTLLRNNVGITLMTLPTPDFFFPHLLF